MKQTNNALKFLTASYLSILKRASIKTYLASSAALFTFITPSFFSTASAAPLMPEADNLQPNPKQDAHKGAFNAIQAVNASLVSHSVNSEFFAPHANTINHGYATISFDDSYLSFMSFVQSSTHTLNSITSVLDTLAGDHSHFKIVKTLLQSNKADLYTNPFKFSISHSYGSHSSSRSSRSTLNQDFSINNAHQSTGMLTNATLLSSSLQTESDLTSLNNLKAESIKYSTGSLTGYESSDLSESITTILSGLSSYSDNYLSVSGLAMHQEGTSTLLLASIDPVAHLESIEPIDQVAELESIKEEFTSLEQAAIAVLSEDSAHDQLELSPVAPVATPNPVIAAVDSEPETELFIGSNLKLKASTIRLIEDISSTSHPQTKAQIADSLAFSSKHLHLGNDDLLLGLEASSSYAPAQADTEDELTSLAMKGDNLQLEPEFEQEAATLFVSTIDTLEELNATPNAVNNTIFGGTNPSENLPPAGSAGTDYDFLSQAQHNPKGNPLERSSRLVSLSMGLQIANEAGKTTSNAINKRLNISVGQSSIQDYTIVSNNGTAVWFNPTYQDFSSHDLQTEQLKFGSEVKLYGAVSGIDHTFSNGLKIGSAILFGQGEADGKGLASGLNNAFSYYGVGFYASSHPTPHMAVSADVTYTTVEHDMSAAANVSGYHLVTGNTLSEVFSVGASAQYDFNSFGLTISPHVGVRYTSIGLDGYDIKVDGQKIGHTEHNSAEVLEFPVGISFANELKTEDWKIKPYADFTLTTHIGSDYIQGESVFDGQEGSVKYQAEFIDTFTYSVDSGLVLSNGNFIFGTDVGYTGSTNTEELTIMAHAHLKF